MTISIPDYEFCEPTVLETQNIPNSEHLEAIEKWIEHYKMLEAEKMQRVRRLYNCAGKNKKYRYKKKLCQNVVKRAIKKKSLKYNDKGMLKIRLWPRLDENGNKLHDSRGVVVKVERYDILAFVRILVAAKSLGNDIFYEFLSIYDVKQIMNNITEDYFGDLRLFLSRDTI
ncbi:MAG: hypothetical protein Q4D02_04815 [Clostridia bacterium]|nr:hypothetical protein [Clostridia bacterium]